MKEWIGVDLDGTLACYDTWRGAEYIGEPIKPMIDRVKKWLSHGKTVKIFTARAAVAEQIPFVKKWLLQNDLPALEVTNVKDMWMVELWDDRCVQVEKNTGKINLSTQSTIE